jgi:hypothetical protein
VILDEDKMEHDIADYQQYTNNGNKQVPLDKASAIALE